MTGRRSQATVLFEIAALVVFTVAVFAEMWAGITPAGSRKAAPNFTLENSAGVSVNLADYRGKVVLLDFWATWCHGCKTEIPWYVEFQDRYKERGLAVIGVSMDDDGWKSVRPFLSEHKLNYPVVRLEVSKHRTQ
jgi:thiol-disulfide isomerase/thioredoxin